MSYRSDLNKVSKAAQIVSRLQRNLLRPSTPLTLAGQPNTTPPRFDLKYIWSAISASPSSLLPLDALSIAIEWPRQLASGGRKFEARGFVKAASAIVAQIAIGDVLLDPID